MQHYSIYACTTRKKMCITVMGTQTTNGGSERNWQAKKEKKRGKGKRAKQTRKIKPNRYSQVRDKEEESNSVD